MERAFKIDLVLYEVDDCVLANALQSWKGRLVMMNILAYYYLHVQKDYEYALKFIGYS
jgi:hypothetical protein